MKECAKEFIERNKDILKGSKPYPLLMKLNEWYKCCPACFMVYKNNGICSYCGLEITIEKGVALNEKRKGYMRKV